MTDRADTSTARIAYTGGDGNSAIAIITIDSPPVNAGSVTMRRDLLAAVRSVTAKAGLSGVIVTGANGNFVAGSDIREFDGPPQEPHLPEIIAAIEACPVPVVAAIDGAALGGGFEIALGSDARVATANSVLGLPEVTLGLIPGAGGTQRLPRLVGIARAMEIITSGRRLQATDALALGMIDSIAEHDALTEARAQLVRMDGQKCVLRALPVAPSSDEEIAGAERAALAKARGAVAVAEAVAAVKWAATRPVDSALAAEREASLRLRVGPQSRALRHLFFAERVAARPPADARPRPVTSAGVIGAGRMGQGIALAFARRGFTVSICENDPQLLTAALAAMRERIEALAARNPKVLPDQVLGRIAGAQVDALADCDLVVEAIFEDMAAKQALFARLDAIAKPGAVLATNTSYLDVDAIAGATARAADIGGLHFFNPADVMKLVEVVRTDTTSDETLATLLAVARKLGKVAVVSRVGEGFIGNRIFSAYRQQCEFLLEDGALPEDVDRAMLAFGMAMGPFAVFDLAGLDIAWATRKRLAPTRDPQARYSGIADQLCERGHLGRKSGRGWYDYTESRRGAPDPLVHSLILEASAAKGIERRAFSDEEIASRLLAAMVNEAAHALAEGIAARASDIDLVLVHGYGFPPLRGGPLHYACQDPTAMLAAIDAMVAASGGAVRRADNLEAILGTEN